MNEPLRQAVLAALNRVAPEVDPQQILPAVNFREQLDIDSMDFLNFIVALHETLQIDIPESDYPKLSTLDDCVAYLELRQSASGESPSIPAA